VHLLGGVAALLFVFLRKFDKASISLPAAAEITSYYWHFMDGLWIFPVISKTAFGRIGNS